MELIELSEADYSHIFTDGTKIEANVNHNHDPQERGGRSRQVFKKLAKHDYTNIVEFAGVDDWTGDIEK